MSRCPSTYVPVYIVLTMPLPRHHAQSVAISHNGRTFTTGSADGVVRQHDWETFKVITAVRRTRGRMMMMGGVGDVDRVFWNVLCTGVLCLYARIYFPIPRHDTLHSTSRRVASRTSAWRIPSACTSWSGRLTTVCVRPWERMACTCGARWITNHMLHRNYVCYVIRMCVCDCDWRGLSPYARLWASRRPAFPV